MKLSGSLCALVTPFSGDGSLDREALCRLIEFQLANGTSGLVIAGSTGEAAMLDEDEYRAVLDLAVTVVAGRVPVLAGTGASATARTVAQCRLAQAAGCDAALVVTPPYVRPTQDGLVRHYTEVAEQGGLPVVLYNVPARTGCDLLPHTVARLRGHARIIGIKEAVADAQRRHALVALQDAGFTVLSGDDPSACAAIGEGMRGVISVAANAAPAAMARLCEHAAADRVGQAREADARLQALYAFLGCEPNPIPIKWLMQALGLCQGHPRLPLLPLSEARRSEAAALAAQLLAERPVMAV